MKLEPSQELFVGRLPGKDYPAVAMQDTALTELRHCIAELRSGVERIGNMAQRGSDVANEAAKLMNHTAKVAMKHNCYEDEIKPNHEVIGADRRRA